MARRTFITTEEKSLPGHKAFKDRLTLALCANAIGDFKIKLLLVYHSEKPRTFKAYKVMKEKLRVLWRANTRVFITGSNGITKLTRCLLDGRSQSSFISSDLVDTLNLPVISTGPLDLQEFESPTSFSHKRRYASHPSSPTDVSRFAKSKRMKLADPDDSLSSLPIEILIGADFYWNVMHSDAPVKLSDSLALVPSFGWILSGS
ncbi:uncharacterized protein NPIL_518671 [Nephila pilipes]|uniref:DDE-1 domain-containing protein n=1 Tax=Nephila pilipes TaxID=299642 RepID=A0A8X6MRE1_NEPPI|nr:uncharacterized protein NPIL_518671 [Nephila pilipes]